MRVARTPARARVHRPRHRLSQHQLLRRLSLHRPVHHCRLPLLTLRVSHPRRPRPVRPTRPQARGNVIAAGDCRFGRSASAGNSCRQDSIEAISTCPGECRSIRRLSNASRRVHQCGRFALFASGEEVAKRFLLAETPLFEPRYNIAPTQAVVVVRSTAAERSLAFLRWGLIPSWASDPAIGNRLINARSERITDKPSFCSSFKQRRCLIPASCFDEWQKVSVCCPFLHRGKRAEGKGFEPSRPRGRTV